MVFSASLQNVLTKSITNWGLSLGKSRISSKWLSNIPCNEQKNKLEYTKYFSIFSEKIKTIHKYWSKPSNSHVKSQNIQNIYNPFLFYLVLVGNFTSFIVNDEPKTHPYPACMYGMKPWKKEEKDCLNSIFTLLYFIEKAIELLKDTNVFPFFSFLPEQSHINAHTQ